MADGIIPDTELFGVMKRSSLEHASSFQPRPGGGRRPRGGHGGDAEKHRRIRGQAYNATLSSEPSFLIYNVVVLAGGLDPSLGDPTALVRVANIYGDSYSTGEKVTCDFNPIVAEGIEWECNQKSSGAEKFRLVRGKCTANVPANDDTFNIDVINPLASGLDPRSDTGSSSETIEVHNVQHESFSNDEHVTAIYRENADGGPRWEVLQVERPRAIRGKWVSGDSTLVIDEVVPLDSGIDPRSNPSVTAETVNVHKLISSDTYTDDDYVWADWSVAYNRWEARPKGITRLDVGIMYTTAPVATTGIGAGGLNVVDPGDGTVKVYRQTTDHSVFANFDDPVSIENWSQINAVPSGTAVIVATTTEGHRFAIPLEGNNERYTADVSTQISAGSAATPIGGSATVYRMNNDGTTTSLGTKTIYNPYPLRIKGSCAVDRINSTELFLVQGEPLHECSQEVVTEVTCDEGELSYDTETIPYVAVECPE